MGMLKICEKCGSGYNWAKGYDNYCYQCTEELKQSLPKLFDDSRIEFVNKLKTAETCPDFTPDPIWLKGTKQ